MGNKVNEAGNSLVQFLCYHIAKGFIPGQDLAKKQCQFGSELLTVP